MLRKDKLVSLDNPSENVKVSDGFLTQLEEACLFGFRLNKQAPSNCVITIDCTGDKNAEQITIVNTCK